MDKTLYFPVFHGIKSEPVKVVCNCDGWAILKQYGFVKSERELPAEIKKGVNGSAKKSKEAE